MEELKIGTRRDLGEDFFVEVTRVCKEMIGHVDVAFSNGRRILYLKNTKFWSSDFEDKRNNRVKDRTGETFIRADGTRLTIINYVDYSDIDILVESKDSQFEVLRHKNISWFSTGLYEGVPLGIRKLGKSKAKIKRNEGIRLSGVIQASQDTDKRDFNFRVEDVVGHTYQTSVGKALVVSCTKHCATVVDTKGDIHSLELEDIEW